MDIIKTDFEGLYVIQHKVFNDERGVFVKTYSQEIFKELGINVDIKERYHSISHKDVIRGMHFQTPPDDHVKLVTVISGRIIDVVLDLRAQSVSYGKYFALEVGFDEGKTIYIPKGFAHGFAALEDHTIVEYNQTTGYAPYSDNGIKYDSFGFNWKIIEPIISLRDMSFETLMSFKTPFL